jgi:type I restriction enzyme S subunit
MNRWPVKPLGDLCHVIAGGTPSRTRSDFYNGEIPWVKISDMLQGTVTHTEETISRLGLDSSAAKLLPPGTVLVSIFATIGRTAVLAIEAATNQAIAGVRPKNPDEISSKFLRFFLDHSVGNLTAEARGVAQLNINGRILKALRIPVPPLAEQERIVTLLDEAHHLRKLREQSDRRTADLMPSLFNEMFGDPTHPENMRWPLTPLGQFAEVSYGLADKLDASTKPADGTRILTISNVLLNGSIDTKVEKYSVVEPAQRAKARLHEFDLLFNWRNGSEEHVGKTAIWEGQLKGEILHVSFLLRIRPDQGRANPYFLWALLNRLRATGYFTRNARMQINRKFNASELSALKLPLPPMPLQKEFAKRILGIRELQSRQAASRECLESLFQSVLHRAFRGEL